MHRTDPDSHSEIRFWYEGKTAPAADDLRSMLHAAGAPVPVYDGNGHRGEYAPVVSGLRDALGRLQRSTFELASSSVGARQEQFLRALLAFTGDARQRVAVLKQLGHFRFRRDEEPEVRQQRLKAAVAGGDDLPSQAQRLVQIWRPESRSFLDLVLQRPAEIGRLLWRRLKAGTEKPLTILCHPFHDLPGEVHQIFVRAGAVACQQDGAIHLLGGIGEHLGRCDAGSGDGTLTALQALLLHELIEIHLAATTPLDGVAAHVVATTAERCIAGSDLATAVESFLVEWETTRRAAGTADPEQEEDPQEVLLSCLVYPDDLRPEAFIERSMAEQRRILREMFGEEWTQEDEAALCAAPGGT